MISKNYDTRCQATQIWFLLKFYENSVFLTIRSALCRNSSEEFQFYVNRQDSKNNFQPKKSLKQIGAGCTPGCQKNHIFIKFQLKPCLSSLESRIITFRHHCFTYSSSCPQVHESELMVKISTKFQFCSRNPIKKSEKIPDLSKERRLDLQFFGIISYFYSVSCINGGNLKELKLLAYTG